MLQATFSKTKRARAARREWLAAFALLAAWAYLMVSFAAYRHVHSGAGGDSCQTCAAEGKQFRVACSLCQFAAAPQSPPVSPPALSLYLFTVAAAPPISAGEPAPCALAPRPASSRAPPLS